jgi:hypothetical protein
MEVQVQDDTGAFWDMLWIENPYTQVAYVGNDVNDRADRFFSCVK